MSLLLQNDGQNFPLSKLSSFHFLENNEKISHFFSYLDLTIGLVRVDFGSFYDSDM